MPIKKGLEKICEKCGVTKDLVLFYTTPSKAYEHGRFDWCKTCVGNYCYDSRTKEIIKANVVFVCKKFDRAFIEYLYDGACERFTGKDKRAILGLYFKNFNLGRLKNLNFADGIRFDKEKYRFDIDKLEKNSENDKIYRKGSSFEVTDEMLSLFGEGHTEETYCMFWDKYNKLSSSYPQLTPLHTEALVTYVKYKTFEERCVRDGKVDEAAKWSAAASKAAEAAKITPKQLSRSDLSGGVNSFSEFMMSLEEEVDIIPILPKFKEKPNDAIDFSIYVYICYICRMLGKPEPEYSEIYKFYDLRVDEYKKKNGDPYNILDKIDTEYRDRIEEFNSMPSDVPQMTDEAEDE